MLFPLCLGAVEVMHLLDADIPLQSDHERSAAALHVPAGEALETKVILSTYHRQARAGSEALADSAGMFVNER